MLNNLIVILTVIMISSCASYLGVPTVKKSEDVLEKYFVLIAEKDIKGAYQLIKNNISYGTDSYNRKKNNGYLVKNEDKKYWILQLSESGTKDFIKESIIIEDCGEENAMQRNTLKNFQISFQGTQLQREKVSIKD